jgi:hypothetical protein
MDVPELETDISEGRRMPRDELTKWESNDMRRPGPKNTEDPKNRHEDKGKPGDSPAASSEGFTQSSNPKKLFLP